MKICLVFPPQAYCGQPPLGLPSIKAFLSANGYRDVIQVDANIECFDRLFTRKHIGSLLAGFQKRLSVLVKNTLTADGANHASWAADLASQITVGHYLKSNISTIKKFVRSDREYHNADDILRLTECSHALVMARKFVEHDYLSHSGKALDDRMTSLLGLSNGLENLYNDPFTRYMKDCLVPRISGTEPGFVGISIISHEQLFYAMLLARLLKRMNPNIYVCFGGSYLSALLSRVKTNREFWFVNVDAMIFNEGEYAVLDLLRYLGGNAGHPSRGEMIYRDRDGDIRSLFSRDTPVDINEIPTPDFDGFPLEKYFSPAPVLPLLTSRCCYWSKCVYCCHYKSFSSFRMRDSRLVKKDIDTLTGKYRTNSISFVDEALPPAMVNSLIGMSETLQRRINWSSEIRLDRALAKCDFSALSAAGCKMLVFGLESGSPRILELMQKGIELETTADILSKCRANGIMTGVMCMMGFPTETKHDLEKTKSFLMDNRKSIDWMAFGQFMLPADSSMVAEREKYEISSMDTSAENLVGVVPFVCNAEGYVDRKAEDVALRSDMDFNLAFPPAQDRYHYLFIEQNALRNAGRKLRSRKDKSIPVNTPICLSENLLFCRVERRGVFPMDIYSARRRRSRNGIMVFEPTQRAVYTFSPLEFELILALRNPVLIDELVASIAEEYEFETETVRGFYAQLVAVGFVREASMNSPTEVSSQ